MKKSTVLKIHGEVLSDGIQKEFYAVRWNGS